MKSITTTQEQISAMADGEISVEQLDEALATLRSNDAQDDWKLYHQIGDLLRSEDMNVHLSKDFSARMAARLEAEPTIIAAAATQCTAPVSSSISRADGENHPAKTSVKRWALPGMAAAAAMAAVAFVTTPQLMVAFKDTPKNDTSTISVAGHTAQNPGTAGSAQEIVTASSSAPGEIVVRDPRIDDYLLAHQRYSPSVYSTAQFARSATFATESNK